MKHRQILIFISLVLSLIFFYALKFKTENITSPNITKIKREIEERDRLEGTVSSLKINSSIANRPQYQTIEWHHLIPKEELELLSMPIDHSITDPDELEKKMKEVREAYKKALVSTNVKSKYDGKQIRIPGFVVPLEFKEKMITQFFLVPYFGACIHVPPPPPNQIIFVNYPLGLKERNIYLPIWISGELTTSTVENTIATSAYSLHADYFEEYYE